MTNKQKEFVEEKNLNNQNYLYQKGNIINQINSSLHYPTPEFNKINFNNSQISEKTIDTLNTELYNRKNLDEQVKTFKTEKEENLLKLKDKEKIFKRSS